MTSWAFYRRGDGKFVPEHVDSRLCTHIVYAYASLSPEDLIAKEFDPWADNTNSKLKKFFSINITVLISVYVNNDRLSCKEMKMKQNTIN